MSDEHDAVEVAGGALTFEDFKQQNGKAYWYASDLMRMMGYTSMAQFRKAMDRAMKACIALGIDQFGNFERWSRPGAAAGADEDYRLTRFACYLTVMNGDPKNPKVAAAQGYFAAMTRQFEIELAEREDVERLTYREDVKDGNKALSSTFKRHGGDNYAFFQNAGYLGMYNMLNVELARQRRIDKAQLFEHMGRAELAANLFRTTMTEERIQNENITGQRALETAHREVGASVRKLVQQNTGRSPEQLPQRRKLPDVKRELKSGYRKMLKRDSGRAS
jgi:DNA-damage-inducible protein D